MENSIVKKINTQQTHEDIQPWDPKPQELLHWDKFLELLALWVADFENNYHLLKIFNYCQSGKDIVIYYIEKYSVLAILLMWVWIVDVLICYL
jgi:hypothetical protein